MNKRGVAAVTVVIFLVLGLLLFVIFGGGSSKLVKNFLGDLGEVSDSFSDDCDEDGIDKTFDQCPCVDKGAKGDNTLTGCPRGTTEEAASNDRKTCYKYPSFQEEGTYTKKCDAENDEDKEKCQTRCEALLGVTSGIKTVEEKETETGPRGNWDLALTKVSFEPLYGGGKDLFSSSRDAQLKVNLGGTEVAVIQPSYTIVNLGEDKDFIETVKVVFEVCNDKKQNCQEIAGSEYDLNDYDLEPTFIRSDSLDVGINGDSCDGSGTRTCYIKLIVAKGDPLNEGSKFGNNVAWLRLILENQKFEQTDFLSYKSVEIQASDGTPGTYQIAQTCQGYVGEQDHGVTYEHSSGVCNSVGGCDGNFQQAESTLWQKEGCWLLVNVDTGEDCGETLAKYGTVISIGPAKSLEKDVSGYYSDDNENDPKELIGPGYLWKALPGEGSLLCSDNAEGFFGGEGQEWWELCNDEHNEQKAFLKDGREFRCFNRQWVAQ
jgi:hypothetical protein